MSTSSRTKKRALQEEAIVTATRVTRSRKNSTSLASTKVTDACQVSAPQPSIQKSSKCAAKISTTTPADMAPLTDEDLPMDVEAHIMLLCELKVDSKTGGAALGKGRTHQKPEAADAPTMIQASTVREGSKDNCPPVAEAPTKTQAGKDYVGSKDDNAVAPAVALAKPKRVLGRKSPARSMDSTASAATQLPPPEGSAAQTLAHSAELADCAQSPAKPSAPAPRLRGRPCQIPLPPMMLTKCNDSAKALNPCPSVVPQPETVSVSTSSAAQELATPVDSAVEHLPTPAKLPMPAAPVPAQLVSAEPFNAELPGHVQAVRATLGVAGERGVQLGMAPAGRHAQFERLQGLLQECCQRGIGSSVYISGLPGTGKSFTVTHAIKSVEAECRRNSGCAAPLQVTLNCMSLLEPAEVYRKLMAGCVAAKQNGGQKNAASKKKAVAVDTACLGSGKGAAAAAYQELVEMLQSYGSSGSRGSAPMFVLMLDEVDRLLSDGTDEAYRLFMLPYTAGVRVVLIAVANSLDLTERLLPALKCRNCQPELLSFPAYSKSSVCDILKALSKQLPWEAFDACALEYVARSVASNSGDLRQALKACSLAVDMLADHNRAQRKIHEKSLEEHKKEVAAYEDAVKKLVELSRAQAVGGSDASCSEEALLGPRPNPPRLSLKSRVGATEMLAAVSRLNGRAQTGSGATSSVATVRGLPVQQQLVLMATAMAVAGAAAAAVAARVDPEGAAAHSAGGWAGVATAGAFSRNQGLDSKFNPFTSQHDTTREASGPDAPISSSRAAGGVQVGSSAMCMGDSAMQIGSHEVYKQYCTLCKELFMKPVAMADFNDGCKLLAEQALLRLVGGSSRCGGGNARSKGDSTKLCLKVLVADVRTALKDNVMFKKIMCLL